MPVAELSYSVADIGLSNFHRVLVHFWYKLDSGAPKHGNNITS